LIYTAGVLPFQVRHHVERTPWCSPIFDFGLAKIGRLSLRKLEQAQRRPVSVSALPRWSPDGKQIAYMSAENGKPWKIFLNAANGGTAKPLLQDSPTESDPTWSPYGVRLAFAAGTVNSTKKSRMYGRKPAVFTNEHSVTKANAFRGQQIQFCRGMLQLHAAAMAGNLHLD
jgi:hypothetical protein